MKIKLCCCLLIFALLMSSCGENVSRNEELHVNRVSEVQLNNLAKLAKVWGYVKYTHPVFLSGEKDWDEELLTLFKPILKAKNDKKANAVLWKWFKSLGSTDYGTDAMRPEWTGAETQDKLEIANLEWLSDIDYLGQNLAENLKNLCEVPNIDRKNAAISFSKGWPTFSNEKVYEQANFGDLRFRLLAVFRFWNVIEYYYPYRNLLDYEWNDVLLDATKEMCAGTDQESYQIVLLKMSAKLSDGHVLYGDTNNFYRNLFGKYMIPIRWIVAENQIVVQSLSKCIFTTGDEPLIETECELLPGDVILEINGEDIWERIGKIKEYVSVPDCTKIVYKMTPYLLRSDGPEITLKVLRNDDIINVFCRGIDDFYFGVQGATSSYVITNDNICIINPSCFGIDDVSVDEFYQKIASTKGVVIDLRQYPSGEFVELISKYFLSDMFVCAQGYDASEVTPGIYLKYVIRQQRKQFSKEKYRKPVVVLIDDVSISAAETTAIKLGFEENVTVIGKNSIGANGAVTYVSMPCGDFIQFTGIGFSLINGEQLQRLGITPDITVEPTITGISQGYDEILNYGVNLLNSHY